MRGIGSARKHIVADVKLVPQVFKFSAYAVCVLLWALAVLSCGLLDLLAVLVGARFKKHLVSLQAVKSSHRIGDDRRVCVTDMRDVVYVINRRHYVFFHHSPYINFINNLIYRNI